jgi:phosphopantothenoylcysteine decarboxylase/phosphopantothenate--cysteine ligase
MLAGKKILIGISGSIAAYKTILLVRLLVKGGADVKVVQTEASKDFVSPLVLATLSKNKVLQDLASNDEWTNHVALGRWADLFIIAPLSCNTLAKMANGICDNLLMATYLSATCPVVVAPAMDEDMWYHGTTKRNLALLESYGNTVIKVNAGELASGLFGEGRMTEPDEIVTFITAHFFRNNTLKGKKVLVTAGPTYEPIDPVRFIGNHSSGKMGFAIAEELYLQGADVILVTGPTHETLAYKGIIQKKVKSAEDMYNACHEYFPATDIAIMSAAVADYTPETIATEKVKKKEDNWALSLTKTKDILFSLGQIKQPHQFIAGFALETNNERENALGKLRNKNADCIVLNSLNDNSAGFGFDTNKITILHKSGEELHYGLKSKKDVAKDIVSFIISKIHG